MGRGVLAVFANGAGGPAKTCRVHDALERSLCVGGVDGGDDLVGVGDVALDEGATNFFGEGFAGLCLQVGNDDVGATSGEEAGGGLTETRCSTGDDCRRVTEFHDAPSPKYDRCGRSVAQPRTS